MRSKLRSRRKRAAAAVEMAIVTPLLLTMLFGIVEYGWLLTVRQAVITGAREASRAASLPGSEVSEVEQRVEDYMAPLGLTTYTTDIECDDDGYPTGVVSVSIPYADISLLGEYFGSTEGTVETTSSMRKETID